MGRIKSNHSWMKHDLLRKVVGPQVAAARMTMPTGSLLLIDANAGDGNGVELEQYDFFGPNVSKPTPILLHELATEYDAKLMLCEKHRGRREQLIHCFKDVPVLKDHVDAAKLALERKDDFDFVLWLADPCGYKDQDLRTKVMGEVARGFLRSDFVVVLNEGSLGRLNGTKVDSPYFQTHRNKQYPELIKPQYWLELLGKRYLARTPLREQSNGFRFRLLVASNYLTDGVKRIHNIEIMERS